MSGLGKVIVVQRDRRAQEAMRLGFEREGAAVVAAATVDEARAAISGEVGLIVAGAEGHANAVEILGALSNALESAGAGIDPPVLYVGNGASRAEAWELGASEVLDPPTYLRDVVTVGKLLASTKPGHRAIVHGELGDTYGVFYLIRAIAATGRSGVLFLARGLRRGEIRFFGETGSGEVTSAQVGGLHGQAAMHQLLLWTEARFEFRHELVVRRRQIPMEMSEVLADAERFLLDIREMASGLSPSAVFEQDVQRMQAMAKKIPTEVHGVLRLFDGNRTLADVLEDGPYRVFETLRVAQRAIESGLLRRVATAKPKAAQRAVLAVEEWLVGTESKESVLDRLKPTGDTGPVVVDSDARDDKSGGSGGAAARRRKKKRRNSQERPAVTPPAATSVEIDWGALVPRATGPDLGSLSTVVPSTFASGEIVVGGAVSARRESREGLEALTDAEQRDRLFPSETVKIDDSIARQQEEDRARAVALAAAEREAHDREVLEAQERAAKAQAEHDEEERRLRAAHEAEVLVAREERERHEREERERAVQAAAAEAAAKVAAEAAAKAAAHAAAEAAARAAAERAASEAADWAAVQKAAADKAADKAAAETAAAGQVSAEKVAVEKAAAGKAAQAAGAADHAHGVVDNAAAHAAAATPTGEEDRVASGLSRENSGEIRLAPPRVSDRPVEAGPSILIEDLAAAHAAATAAVGKPVQRKRESTPPPQHGEVARVRADAAHVTAHATHFTDDEEAFFQEGQHLEAGKAAPPGETFHDLDEGYQPQTFWERLTGKAPVRRKPGTVPPPVRGGSGTRKR